MNHTAISQSHQPISLSSEVSSIHSVSKEDLLLINQLLLNLYRLKTRDEQALATLEMLKALVPSVIACWTRFNNLKGELQYTTLPNIPSSPKDAQQVAQVANQSPFPIYFAVSGDRSWRMVTDFMPIEEFQQTELFQLTMTPMGCVHIISTMLDKVGDDHFSLALCRAEAYSERDRTVLNLVYPHLNLSYYNLQAYEQASRSLQQYQTVVESAPLGYAFIQSDGKIGWVTSKAREIWKQHFPTEPTYENGAPASVIAWLERCLAARPTFLPALEAGLAVPSPAQTIEMRLLPSPFDGLILTVGTRSPEPLARFRPLPSLTSRQNETLQWMTEGKRNSEIAAILGISERTVEKHVAEVLQQMEAENRATAIVKAMEFCAVMNAGGAGI